MRKMTDSNERPTRTETIDIISAPLEVGAILRDVLLKAV